MKFVPYKPEKEVISMRIPTNMLNELNDRAAAMGISRNELINQCITFAFSNMEMQPVQASRLQESNDMATT